MDQPAVLSGEELAAGLKFLECASKIYPIEVAFWMGRLDPKRYNLYEASPEFSRDNRVETGHRLKQVARELDSLFLDPWSIKTIELDEPVTQRAIELRQNRNGVAHSWSNPVKFHGRFVGPMYVYSERNLASFVMV